MMENKRLRSMNEKAFLCARNRNMLDRESVIEFIKQQLKHSSDVKPNICYIHGISGVGKSYLFEYLYPYIKYSHDGNFELVSLKLNFGCTEKQIAYWIYKQLKDCKSFVATQYEVANKYLYFQTSSVEYNVDFSTEVMCELICGALQGIAPKPNILETIHWDELKNICDKFLAPELINGFGSQFDQLADILLDKVSAKLKDAAKEMIRNKLEQQVWISMESFLQKLRLRSNEENERCLLQYLLEDIDRWMKGREEDFHLIFLVDTFENRMHSSDSDFFIKRMLPALNHSTWILFGTEEPIDVFNEALLPYTHCWRLESFGQESTVEVRSYLRRNNINDTKDQDFIIDKSKGLPAAIQIFIDAFKKSGTFKSMSEVEGYQDLFSYYFAKHLTEIQRKTLIRLSLFEQWDFEIFKYVEVGNCGDIYQRFQELAHNGALVLPSHDGSKTYRIPDIVKKTIHSLKEFKDSLYDAHRIRWNYYSKLLESHGPKEVKNQIEYQQMELYLKVAFQSALSCYITENEFLDISKWCKNKEQELSKYQFWALKEHLIQLYLNTIENKDHFAYDRKITKESISYRLKFVRDLVWSCRKMGNFERAREYAGQFLLSVLEKQGIEGGYVPFAFYLMGLMYYDLCQHETSVWFLQKCIEIAKEYGWDSHEKVKFYVHIAAPNMLGCIYMDCARNSEAIDILGRVQKIREDQENGLVIGYSNLSRLYLQSAQGYIKNSLSTNNLQKAGQAVIKSKDYWEKEKASHSDLNLMTDLQLKSREIAINILEKRLECHDSNNDWEADIKNLTEIIKQLKRLPIQATLPLIMGIEHNIAILFAWSGDWKTACTMLKKCLEKKRAYYGACNHDSLIENRAAVRLTREALEYIQDVIEGNEDKLEWNRLVILS